MLFRPLFSSVRNSPCVTYHTDKNPFHQAKRTMPQLNNQKKKADSIKRPSPSPSRINGVAKPRPLVVDENNKHVLGGYFGLGLNNFYKATLSIFARTGIKIASKNGTVLYPEEKIGQVIRVLRRSISDPSGNFTHEEKVWSNAFKLSSSQEMRLQKLIFHHFPILGPIMADEGAYKASTNKKSKVTDAYSMTYGVTLEECLDVLGDLAQTLVDCRNSYTHFYPYNSKESTADQLALQSKTARYLDKVFTASRRLDKDRNNIDTAMMEFITGSARHLRQYVERYGFYPKYDETVTYEKDARGRERMKKKMTERDDFFYKIGNEKECDGKRYTVLSGFGLSFFCAVFLSKTQTRNMLADIRLFETSPYPKELDDIIRDMMSIYRIRAPRGKKKLEAGNTGVTLALDILNELRRCPRELYDVLTTEGRKFFEDETDRTKDAFVPDDALSPDTSADNASETVKRIRWTDRFPQLVMKYVDETEFFKNIRFQVRLGKYRFKFYDKLCINGEEDLRGLQKEINGFGRIQEMEPARKEKYGDMMQPVESERIRIDDDLELDLLQFAEDSRDSSPYITDSRTAYNINNNRIGLYWNELTVNGRTIPKPGDHLPDLGLTPEGKADVDMPAPMAMLSLHELPAMVFYQYLLSQNADPNELKTRSAENLIIGKFNSLRRLFTDISEGRLAPQPEDGLVRVLDDRYGLTLREIPDKLTDFLTGKKGADQSKRRRAVAERTLLERLRKAIRRRDRYEEDRKKIGEKDNKYAKKAYSDVRHGSLGRYLSESLIEWQPTLEGGKDKLTGMNFNKLQAELATFNSPEKYTRLRETLSAACMLSGPIAHPFLRNVTNRKIRNIEELYLIYLDQEIGYLKTLLNLSYKGGRRDDRNIDFEASTLKTHVDVRKLPLVKGEKRWEKRTPDYCRELAKRYLEVDGRRTSIWLPEGIFSKAITDLLKRHYSGNDGLMDRMRDDSLNNNVAYLINAFFETVLDDHSQPFYMSYDIDKNSGKETPNRFARVYDLFDILNNRKIRNALVKVPMTCNQIAERFTAKNRDGRKRILAEIDDRTAGMTSRDIGSHASLKEAKEVMRRRLTHMIGDVKDNERCVRRYKTQDMILFLMASQLLGDAIRMEKIDSLDKFRLSAVCNAGFLNQTMDFEFPVQMDGNVIYIRQDNMSLKNYGEFYQLLSDDRLPSLLEKLADGGSDRIDYGNLMGELTSYDLHRSRIFKAVHMLERRVTSDRQFRIFLNNPCDRRFYINDDASRMAKRNNFRSLLMLLEQGDTASLTESERNLIISIRNAFSHNHYSIDLPRIAPEKRLRKTTLLNKDTRPLGEKKTSLTTIATLIAARLEELQKKLESKH